MNSKTGDYPLPNIEVEPLGPTYFFTTNFIDGKQHDVEEAHGYKLSGDWVVFYRLVRTGARSSFDDCFLSFNRDCIRSIVRGRVVTDDTKRT
jgi:hypothetical protein